jgi:NAD(P)-dependent dehydrogenase (short-subunit alcohol dehydrogenase family)
MSQQHTLFNKRVILLGASSGIGLATAKAAATEGAKIVIVSSNPERLRQALAQLPEGSEGHPVDLSREENIKKFFNQNGSFDHLVYTAGENLNLNLISETVVDKARDFFGLRFWSAFAAVKYGAPNLNPGGSISLTSGTASARCGLVGSIRDMRRYGRLCPGHGGGTRARPRQLCRPRRHQNPLMEQYAGGRPGSPV